MPTLAELLHDHSVLQGADLEWLHLLVGDWQVVSDLAFADLVLWLPTDDGDFVAIAQCRPSTGATVHYDDVVGSRPPEGQRPQLQRSLTDLLTWAADEGVALDDLDARSPSLETVFLSIADGEVPSEEGALR